MDIWVASADAVITGAANMTTERLISYDIKAIEAALSDEDVREALRIVDGRVAVAPDSKARSVLPNLFPQANGSPGIPQPEEPLAADINGFCVELRKSFVHSPKRRGPGPGGGRCEYWSWLPAHKEAWEEVSTVCLI